MTTTFIEPPIDTDPDDLVADAIDLLQAQFPGWVPNAGNLDTWLLEAFGRMAAEVATTAASVPVSIFRYLGPLFGVNPIEATPASATSTWTMRDDAGYTIPAGTLISIPGPGGTTLLFAVLYDRIVDEGSTATSAGAVILIAVDAGAAGSGLGSEGLVVEPVNVLDFVTSIELTGQTTGGVDAETDADYLDRLAAELQLLTPRPILPSDFATLARNISAVARALAIDLYQPGVNEVQQLSVDATSGQFTLTFGGHTTGGIDCNAPASGASSIQEVLEALPSIGAGNVICTGTNVNLEPCVITFVNDLGNANQALITTDDLTLAGGAATAEMATTRNGAAPVTDQERTVSVAVVDENGNAVDGNSKTALQALLEAMREVNFIVNIIDPSYTEIDVSFTYELAGGYAEADVTAAAEGAVAGFLTPANWGLGGGVGDTSIWVDTDTVRLLDLARVIGNIVGVSHVVEVQLAVHGDSLATDDIVLPGPASMPTAGDITGATA